MEDGWSLWVDDELETNPHRAIPKGFTGAKSSKEAIDLVLKLGLPDYMSLDYCLRYDYTVMEFLRWLVNRFPNGPVPVTTCHSKSYIGRREVMTFVREWRDRVSKCIAH